MKLQEIIDYITHTLEIEDKFPDNNGVYSFSFEKDVDIQIFQLNTKNYIVLGNIYILDNSNISTNIIDECAKLSVGVLKLKKTVVYMDGESIALYHIVSNEQNSKDIFVKYIRDFIYDMNWWKQRIGSYVQLNSSQSNNISTWISG